MCKISWKPSTDSPAAKVTPSSMMVLDRRMALQNGSATPLEGPWRASGWNPICFPKAKWSPNSRKDDESEGDLDFEQLGWRRLAKQASRYFGSQWAEGVTKLFVMFAS